MTELNKTITVEGLSEFQRKLEQLLTDNPGFERRLRNAIRTILREVQARLRASAQQGLQMKSDPRHAYKAVRYAVYKKLFGGNVNILDSQKAPSKAARARPRTLRPGQRGGNRKPQTVESKDIYEGSARGFILRFLNAGTTARYAGHGRIPKKPDDRDKWIIDYGGKGFRGAIAPRNWFGPRSQKELEAAAGNLQEIIDRVINNEFA